MEPLFDLSENRRKLAHTISSVCSKPTGVRKLLWIEEANKGVRDKRYGWTSTENMVNKLLKFATLQRNKQKHRLGYIFKRTSRIFQQVSQTKTIEQKQFLKQEKKKSKTAATHFFFSYDSSTTAKQLVWQMTSSFLCSPIIPAHYAHLALWFLRPFLYSMMSFYNRDHPRRQSLYEVEPCVSEALAPALSAQCCNAWAPMLLVDSHIIRDSEQEKTPCYYLWAFLTNILLKKHLYLA